MPELDRPAGVKRAGMRSGGWRNRSPGDLSIALPEAEPGNVSALIAAAVEAAPVWAGTSLPERIARLRSAQQALAAASERLAHGIALETGKPITEALGEAGGLSAKIDLS